MDATTRHLLRVRRRLVLERALKHGATAGWLAASAILVFEVAARFVPLPDARVWLGVLLVLTPLLCALWSLRRTPDTSRISLRAGALAGMPGLFAALGARATRLTALLRHRANEAARKSEASGRTPLQVGRWTRAASLPCLLSVLVLLAPGRVPPADALDPHLADAVARESRHVARTLQQSDLTRQEREAARKALADLGSGNITLEDLNTALSQLARASRAAGGDPERIARTLESDELLREVARGIRTGDRELIQRALSQLAERIRGAPPDGSARQTAGARLAAVAAEVTDGELARLLREAGAALTAGTGSEAADALQALGPRLAPLPPAAFELQRMVVFLEGTLRGHEPAGSGTRPQGEASTLAAQGSRDASEFAFVPGARLRETPRHEAILRAYFGLRTR